MGVNGWYDVLLIAFTALLGLFGVASALNGYLFRKIPMVLRLLLVAGGLGMMVPGLISDAVGLVAVGGVVLFQYFSNKKSTAAAA